MGYQKHNYKSGEVLTASQLNEMDEQIAANETNIGGILLKDASISGNTVTIVKKDGTTISFTIGGGSSVEPSTPVEPSNPDEVTYNDKVYDITNSCYPVTNIYTDSSVDNGAFISLKSYVVGSVVTTKNHTINPINSTVNAYTYLLIKVFAGDIITFKHIGSSVARAYALVNLGKTCDYVAESNVNFTTNPKTITIEKEQLLIVNFEIQRNAYLAEGINSAGTVTISRPSTTQNAIEKFDDWGSINWSAEHISSGNTNSGGSSSGGSSSGGSSSGDTSSGGAEPEIYIKDASVSGNTLTLTKKDGTKVEFSIETLNDVKGSKINNPAPNFSKLEPITFTDGEGHTFTSNGTLRILVIGNSFTEDSTNQLNQLVQNLGCDISNFSFSRAMRSNSSFKSWVDCYYDRDTRTYTVAKNFGGLSETYTGDSGIGNGEKFRNALIEHKYDVIVIQQAPPYSHDYSAFESHEDGGYLKEFIRILKMHQPQATIAYLLVHSAPNNDPDTLGRWKSIAETAKFMQENYGVQLVIPYGTAIQNLRASSFGENSYGALTRDNLHLGYGLPRYTAVCTYYEALLAPFFKKSMYGNTYRPNASAAGLDAVDLSSIDERYRANCIDVDDTNALVAQKAALLAIQNMYEVVNPEQI